MVVVPTALVALAAFAAAAARPRPLSLALVAPLAVLAMAATAAGGAAMTGNRMDDGATTLVGMIAAGRLAVAAAVLALAGAAGGALTKAGWTVAAVLAVFALAPVTLYAAIVPGILLRAGIGAANPYTEAMSFQPGVLLVVVPVAAALARWLGQGWVPSRR